MSTAGYKIRKNSPPPTILKFREKLLEIGHNPSTAKVYSVAAGKFLRYCRNLFSEPSRELLSAFLSEKRKQKYRRNSFNLIRDGAVKFMAFLEGKEIPHIVGHEKRKEKTYTGDFLQEAFRIFLTKMEKVNSPYTIGVKRKHLTEFLICCDGELIPERILTSLIGRTKGFRLHAKQFLSFCFKEGYTERDYSVQIISGTHPKKLPAVYSEKEISKAVGFRSYKSPLRDRAIMLLIATTGIRSCDVVSLKRKDIDAEEKRLSIIQKKTGVPLSLPLSEDTVEAVSDYIESERPNSDSEFLFLASVYPFGKLDTGSIRYLVTRNLSKTGTDISMRKHGPHSLRSSLASALVAEGMSLEVTRKALGHSNLSSLNRYVKLDKERLREYALPVTKPQGRFAEWLKEAGK